MPSRKIYSVATDGARSMTGSRIGFTTLLKNDERTRNDLLAYHCIIHQENPAALHSASLMDVMNDVITIVNYIKSHALNHRQFKAILKEYDTNYGELVYHSEVRWLSKGAVLDHVFHLFDPIKQFFAEKSCHLPEKWTKFFLN